MSDESVQPSFREQTMSRLADERGQRVEEPAPENVQGTAPEIIEDEVGTPEPEVTDDVIDVEAHEVEDEIEPESDEDQTLEDVEHDWEKRFKDAQAELTKLYQNRDEFETEMASQLTEVKRREFELDDVLRDSRQHAELLMNALTGQADQYRNIDFNQVPADQVGALQQAAKQAFAQEQQVSQALEQIKARQKQAYDTQMQREAELTRTRLKKTIPGWSNETYDGLREYAVSRGLDPTLFNSITNPAVIEMIHDSMQLRSAGSKAKTLSKRKSQKLSTANSPTRVRDARGKFASAKQAFNDTPNQRGAFAKMKEAQLAMEGK